METNQINKITTTKSNMHKYGIFTIFKDPKDKQHKICLGDGLISEQSFGTLASAKKYIDSKPYEIIINIACFANYIMSNNENKM